MLIADESYQKTVVALEFLPVKFLVHYVQTVNAAHDAFGEV